MNLSSEINTMLSLDAPSNKIVKARTTLHEMYQWGRWRLLTTAVESQWLQRRNQKRPNWKPQSWSSSASYGWRRLKNNHHICQRSRNRDKHHECHKRHSSSLCSKSLFLGSVFHSLLCLLHLPDLFNHRLHLITCNSIIFDRLYDNN